MIVLSCCALVNSVNAQPPHFQKSIGPASFSGSNDITYSMLQTWDSGFIICGSTQSYGAGSIDAYIAKYDSAGNQVWAKTYGTANWEATFKLIITADSGYLFAGGVIDSGQTTKDVLLIKTDKDGGLQWSKKYGGGGEEMASTLEGIEQTSDLGYIITGTTNGYDSIPSDNIFLIKTDAVGDTLWTRIYSAPLFDQALAVHQTFDGGYILSGRTTSFGAGQRDALLIKTDSAGMITWVNAYGGIEGEEGMSVKQTSDSGFILTGSSYSFSTTYPDIYTIKTDGNGTVQWSKIYDGGGVEASYCIIETTDGGYALTGFTESFISPDFTGPGNPLPQGGDSANVILIKLDTTGAITWSKIYGGKLLDEAYSLSQATDGGYLMAAITSSFGSDSTDNGYIIYTDSIGAIDCFTDPVVMQTINAATITTPGSYNITWGFNYSTYNLSEALFVLQDTMPECPPVGLDDHLSASTSLSIYPNPSNFSCVVAAPGFVSATLILYDLTGRVLQKHSFNERANLYLKTLNPGVYIIEVKDNADLKNGGMGKSVKGKIVIN